MAAEQDDVPDKDQTPPHLAPIVRARRLASPADAHDELRSGFNSWSGSISKDGVYAVYAVIAANWAVHGSADKLLDNTFATWSLVIAIAYLASQVFLTWRMSVLYRQRCEYANADTATWAKEYKESEGIDSPWPYTDQIQNLGERMRFLHVAGPLLSGTLFVTSLFYSGGAVAAESARGTTQDHAITFLDAIVAYAERIPATFWGVVVGSFFTLIGIYFTNRAQTSRQKIDLAHNRSERKSDREFAARKEIFVEAAGGLFALTQCLGRISNVDIPFAQIMAESQSHSTPVARAYIIARDDTVEALARLSSGIHANLLKLSTLRHQLDASRRQVTDLEGKQRRHQDAANRVIESVRRINLEEGLGEGRANAARIMLDYEQQQDRTAAQERDQMMLQARPLEIELAEATLAASLELWPDIVAAIAAIRIELGLNTDQAKLLSIIRDASRRPLEEFDKIIRTTKEDLQKRKATQTANSE